MTEKLYYEHPTMHEFDAEVIETIQDKKLWKVLLDRTCFYPAGGGQPSDKGYINDTVVVDVKNEEEGTSLWHYCRENPGQGIIKGKIDWQWRWDFMQQHTGQHVLSAAFMKIGNYQTVGVHLGNSITTIELKTATISNEQVKDVEKCAQDIIQKNAGIRFFYSDHEHSTRLNLRRECKKTGIIRIIEIDNVDRVACGGIHCQSTGELGLVKLIGTEKIRGNVRTIWKIGERAFRDYDSKSTLTNNLKPLLSIGDESSVISAITQIQNTKIELEKKNRVLETRIAKHVANDLWHAATMIQGNKIILTSFQNESDSIIMKICNDLLSRDRVILCFISHCADKIYWYIGCSEGLEIPFDAIKKTILPIINGKGGGRHPLWKGIGMNPEKSDLFLEKCQDIFS